MIMSDWEGPWVTADHAYEITKRGVPNGDRLFATVSEYDDYLAYIKKKKGYEPGDTLALIAPFLIAYGINNDFLVEVAKDNANFIKGSLEAIGALERLEYDLQIISTSYCQYVHYTTRLAGIFPKKISCTDFPIDAFSKTVDEKDKEFVRKKAQNIIGSSSLGISSSTREIDLTWQVRKKLEQLDRFFWQELPKTSFRELLNQIHPLGGHRKLEALLLTLKKNNLDLQDTAVIGDSITDWIMLKETKEAGGLAISFNGNDYAVRNANVAIISDNCLVTPVLVDLFFKTGLGNVEKVTNNWGLETLKETARKGEINPLLFESFLRMKNKAAENFPLAVWLDKDNIELTIKRSKEMRKSIRGVAIGSLG